MALQYGRLGDTENALSWLEEASCHKGGQVIYARVHPYLDSLRDDPRYLEILEKMNLAD